MVITGSTYDWGANAGQAYANAITTIGTQQNTWQATLAGIIGTVGVIQQALLLERQVDLQERTVDQAQEYLDLTERSYEEVTLNAYNCQKELFTRYRDTFADCAEEFLTETKRLAAYTPAYDLQEGRAVSSVQRNIDRAEKRRKRQRGKYSTGACCHEGIWFSMEAARLSTDAANHAYRYEDDRKLRLDEWYFQRQSIGAQLVENMRAHVISGVNSGTTNVANGLNAIGNGVQALRASTSDLAGGIRDQASFFGSVANGAFRFAGFNNGFQSAAGAPGRSWYGGDGNGLANALASPSSGFGLTGAMSALGGIAGSDGGFGGFGFNTGTPPFHVNTPGVYNSGGDAS